MAAFKSWSNPLTTFVIVGNFEWPGYDTLRSHSKSMLRAVGMVECAYET